MVTDYPDRGAGQAHDAQMSTSAWLEEIRGYWAELCRRYETGPGPMTTGGPESVPGQVPSSEDARAARAGAMANP